MLRSPTADASRSARRPPIELLPGVAVNVDTLASAPALPPLALGRRSARAAAERRLIVGTL